MENLGNKYLLFLKYCSTAGFRINKKGVNQAKAMICQLTGIIREKIPEGIVVIEVSGVGYEVHVPVKLLNELSDKAHEVTLYTHMSVKEDGITLYGFPSRIHLSLFRLLLQVKNIGPKHAMKILSVMKPQEAAYALQRQDSSKFRSVPGIGKKTAEMIIVELKDKISKMQTELRSKTAASYDKKIDDVASALLHLGFRTSEVQNAISAIKESFATTSTVEQLIREALAKLTE